MQLYILDKDPTKSANMIPDKYKFKMLIELGQLVSTLTLNGIYKPVKQGKELVHWIGNNRKWTYWYMHRLFTICLCSDIVKMKEKTVKDIMGIMYDKKFCPDVSFPKEPLGGYFRYAKEYICDIPSKTLLPIDECINEYKKYVQWKINVKKEKSCKRQLTKMN